MLFSSVDLLTGLNAIGVVTVKRGWPAGDGQSVSCGVFAIRAGQMSPHKLSVWQAVLQGLKRAAGACTSAPKLKI